MALPPGRFIVDTHQDLAYHCLEYGRDLVDPRGTACMITLPWLQRAGVRLLCATLFTEPRHPESIRRYQLHSQYEMYRQWFSRYPAELQLVRDRSDLTRLAASGAAGPEPRQNHPIGVVLLMEGCDLLTSPAEAQTWFKRGVRMVCVTWNSINRYASGCFTDGGGFTALGRELLSELARLGFILDLSHLTVRGIEEALQLYPGPLCSGHSNARGVCDHERNLTDVHVRAVASRGGVIGLNLLAPLLVKGWRRGDPQPPLAAATQHVVYLANLGGLQCVGIGADLDGGLTPENTPQGIDRVDHLPLLADDLARRGWTADETACFLGVNWWRFFEQSLPR